MTITQLRYFLVLAKELNFTHAAKQLFISQTTLSQHIAKLESELDILLFERNRTGLTLTAEGKYLCTSAEMLLDELDDLPRTLHKIQRISRGGEIPREFSIGLDSATFSMDSYMTDKFISAIKTAEDESPSVEINITEVASTDMLQQLLDGTIHMAVGSFHYPKSSRIHSKEIVSQQFNLAVKDDGSWDKSLPKEKLISEIISKKEIYTINFDEQYNLKTQEWLDNMGANQVLKFAKTSWMLQLHLYLGDLAAIVPSNRFDSGFSKEDLIIIPIEDLYIERYISWPADNEHPLVMLFLDTLQ